MTARRAVAFDFPQDHPIRGLLDGKRAPLEEHVTHDVLLRNGVILIEYLANTQAIRQPRVWFCCLPSTFVMDHFDFFGLRQVWARLKRREYTPPEFKDHFYYRLVRHPLMLGFFIAFWAIPYMSVGHLLFAVATTGYILVALQFEERDLIEFHGDDYRRYRKEVPMLCPWPRPRTPESR